MKSQMQRGFTLVEIAIVLVIIGLLLGGVLKGQEMIDNGKIKAAAQDLNGIVAGYNSYVDRFRAVPGDDGPNVPTLQARGANWANITVAGNANGVGVYGMAPFAPTGENLGFWQHLRAAGFISGNPAGTGVAALPRNAFGGVTGVVYNATTPFTVYGMAAKALCMSEVPGKAARALDLQMDDGNPQTGNMRSEIGNPGANTAPVAAAPTITAFVDEKVYTICMSF